MSARYEFQINQGGRLEISVGGSVVSVSTPESHTFRAIRQQSADIAELRNELADALDVRLCMDGAPTALGMVVAERDQLRAELAECRKELAAAELYEVSCAFSELSGPRHDHG